MKSNKMFESLESRRLFSGDLNLDAYGGSISYMVSGTIDDGGRVLVTVVDGDKRSDPFVLPSMKADGSVDLTGTTGADSITVERVGDLLSVTPSTNGEYDFVSYRGGTGPFQMGGLPKMTDITKGIDHESDMLAQRQAKLDKAEADGVTGDDLDRAKDELNISVSILAMYNNMLDKIQNSQWARYRLAGVFDFYAPLPADAASKASVTIDAGAGNDSVTISSNFPLRSRISGGSGADTLTSGKRATILSGNGGNDRLISRSVKGGTLDGGAGADRYYNRADDTEIHIVARNDGDQVVTDTRSVRITQPGMFGTQPISSTTLTSPLSGGAVDGAVTTTRRNYYLVDGAEGQVDL